ncbi:myosin light chain kinase, smooth muscle isoform X2 [Hoplias malabaricus]|uniref:myosin light chain kinase, smooth muscle isoform X2 n=1 Tax=Hoplias malabaricus TaxID=27720 RepID=UPI003461B5CB
MSVCGEQKRYVSTLRIQLSAPASGGDRRSNTSSSLKNGERASNSMDEDAAPFFLEPLQDFLVDEGNDIILKGAVRGKKPIKVSWLHNGEALCFGKSSFIDGEVKLVVRECLPEDAGAYTCVAENTEGKMSCSSAVCVREMVVAARKSNTTRAQPLAAGLKNGVLTSPLSPLDESSVFRGGPESPQTESPQAQSPAHRKVIPLQVVSSCDKVEVPVGEKVCLSCEFKGNHPIVSCWIHNREEVVESCRFSIESSSESSVLVISDAQPEDSGRYTLVLRDRKSSTQHTLTLSVIERPQPPASCPVVCVLSQSSVVLSWSGPCYDGGSAVTGYVVEIQSVDSNHSKHWTELSAHCRSTSLRVTSGLKPQGQYRFRVRACNTVGISEPSQESQVIKMDGPGNPHEEKLNHFVTVTVDDKHKVTDHYNVMEKLGVGKFGQVFRLTHKETGRVCAGKFYKGRRAKEREAAKREIELMNFLHHPQLVQCLAAYDNKPEIVMVMEFIAGGELFERIVDDNFEHTEPSSVGYMRQILQGIQYMHQQNIVHLDLKPENIVCMDKTGIQIKIIDFGLASKLDPSNPLKVMHGTPEFVAPEVINFEPICLATDMWSIGVICFILLSGESPFQGDSDSETLALVTAAQWEFDEESFEDITDKAKDFISSLLHKDVRRRMNCEEALSHSWMAAFESVDPSTAKNLSKDKMKKFLARQKWKKTGKAVLALKRMAMLSKADSSASLPSPVDETDEALKTLEKKMQSKPEFTKTPIDLSVFEESTAEFFCQVKGYPDPEVVWIKDGEVLEEKEGQVQVDYEEDGTCVLTLENVNLQHSGSYSCRAMNVHGEAVCTARLIVADQEEDTN